MLQSLVLILATFASFEALFLFTAEKLKVDL
jgi:hypothetical protein